MGAPQTEAQFVDIRTWLCGDMVGSDKGRTSGGGGCIRNPWMFSPRESPANLPAPSRTTDGTYVVSAISGIDQRLALMLWPLFSSMCLQITRSMGAQTHCMSQETRIANFNSFCQSGRLLHGTVPAPSKSSRAGSDGEPHPHVDLQERQGCVCVGRSGSDVTGVRGDGGRSGNRFGNFILDEFRCEVGGKSGRWVKTRDEIPLTRWVPWVNRKS